MEHRAHNSAVMQVKIVIIDSITFHFRQEFQDMAQRTRILAQLAQTLMRHAESKDIAVGQDTVNSFLDLSASAVN